MKLAILGATGRTGRHVVEQALTRGHTVTALVRDPAKLADMADPRLRVVRTDVMEPDLLAAELSGHEAVVSAIGPPANGGPTTVCTDSAGSIVQAMERAGVSRLVAVSASGPHTDGDGPVTRLLVKPVLQRILRHAFTDMLGMEEVISRSALDWTVVRPPRLTDKPLTGNYRVRAGGNVRRGMRIPRADLAHATLEAVGDKATVRSAVWVAT